MGLSLKTIGKRALGMLGDIEHAAQRVRDEVQLRSYLRSDRRPWRTGYGAFRNRYLRDVLHESGRLALFRDGQSLPAGYGFRLDARVVEIPWALARIEPRPGRLLDAGSSLNAAFVLTAPALAQQEITIVTLAPERECHHQLRISYLFGDLRRLDFRDDLFDNVVCISTIEHVGMSNTMYAGAADVGRRGEPDEFLSAVRELKRVLKPGGRLCITFPFGRYEDHGWFQQLDQQRADLLVAAFAPMSVSETIFKYEPNGWVVSDRAACAQCEFFDVHTSKYFDPSSTIEYPADYPAGERAVACLQLIK